MIHRFSCIFTIILLLASNKSFSDAAVYRGVALDGVIDDRGNTSYEIVDPYLESIEINLEDKYIDFSGGNTLSTAKIKNCNDKEWYCIRSKDIKFSIPKSWNEQVKSWNHKNVKYDVLENHGMIKTKSSEHVYYISATGDGINKDSPLVYMYSKKEGLMGFVLYFSSEESKPRPINIFFYKTFGSLFAE